MEYNNIVALYWARSEKAIAETSSKYGKYCYAIACNILSDKEDADESVNDTYMDAWNSMPPHRPSILSTFLGKITRRISIDRCRTRDVAKRGGGTIMLVLDELTDCIPSNNDVMREIEITELAKIIDGFIMKLPTIERHVFICRYWYLDPITSICEQFSFSQSKVKSMLQRTWGKLLSHLEKEDMLL